MALFEKERFAGPEQSIQSPTLITPSPKLSENLNLIWIVPAVLKRCWMLYNPGFHPRL
jgi:hypothetical protein